MATESNNLSLEMDEFIEQETRKDTGIIEIGFTPTFDTADLDIYLKKLSLHVDLNLIEMLTEFTEFNVYLKVDVQYVRNVHHEFLTRVNSFNKKIDRSTDTHGSIQLMFEEIHSNNDKRFNLSSDVELQHVMYAELVIYDCKPAAVKGKMINPKTRRQLFPTGKLSMQIFKIK